MYITERKQQFSIAYVRAIVSVAGFVVYEYAVDDDSIDIGIAAKGLMGTVRSPKLDIQLKCTSRSILGADTERIAQKLSANGPRSRDEQMNDDDNRRNITANSKSCVSSPTNGVKPTDHASLQLH